MSRMHPQHHVPLHVLYEHVNDKRVKTPRCSRATANAIKTADAMVKTELASYGHECKRVLLVFVDDHAQPDYLACVVFSLGHGLTLVADVNDSGEFVAKSLHAVNTSKNLPRSFMYDIVHKNLGVASDFHREEYNTRVYARNRSCYV